MYFYLYFALYEDDEVWERFQELNLINQFINFYLINLCQMYFVPV